MICAVTSLIFHCWANCLLLTLIMSKSVSVSVCYHVIIVDKCTSYEFETDVRSLNAIFNYYNNIISKYIFTIKNIY